MRGFRKLKAPYYLKKNWKKWGVKWKLQYKDSNKNNNFNWICDREDLIINYLAKVTNCHCSYCDVDNINVGSSSTIDHFKPKSKFFRFAYHYNNLFNCCSECQKRNEKYSNFLIKPDIPNYKFQDFFEIDITSGKINPNPIVNELNQTKARLTIEFFRLNYGEKPNLRLNALSHYLIEIKNAKNPSLININNYSYRFFIEEYIRIVYYKQ